jgi:aryl-alcohol dehydrogenase-like predicted oxidoreductase
VRYREFGDTGLRVSEIGLGAWQLGNRADWAGGPDEAESRAIVRAALDGGVTFFDTAPGYGGGESSRILGQALRGHRDEVMLCTKFGHSAEGTDFSVERLRASVQDSLRQLQTDVIDMVLMHNPPAELYDGTRTSHYEAFEQLKTEGLIRAYGGSLDGPQELDTLLATTRSRAVEVYLSAFHQETWPAVERAGAAGVGSVVKVALESGWLAGRYAADSVFTDIRARWSPETPAQTALRFVLANSGVSTVIPGAKSVAQVASNLAAADDDLPAETVAEIRQLFADRIAAAPLPW